MDELKRLAEVHEAAKNAGVSYSLNYCEADDSFSFSIRSTAPSEEWQSRDYSFNTAIDCALEWLSLITAK
jgi:hypothetical protein